MINISRFSLIALLLPIGAAALTISNTATILINDSSNPPTLGTPYPSSIIVTGMTGQAVSKVAVTLQGFGHGFPSDVDVLLIGPQNQMSFLMAEVGGYSRYSVTNLTLTLDDDALNALPVDAPLVSGTFQPTKRAANIGFDLPPPALPGNSNAPAALSVFKNTDPNGTWRLFVVDDTYVDAGIISGGWNLSIDSYPVRLFATPTGTNVVLSWTALGYTLQTSPSLAPPVIWTNASPAPSMNSGWLMVTNLSSGPSRFYRLAK